MSSQFRSTIRSASEIPECVGDIGSGLEQSPVSLEVFHDVAAVAKAVHDVGELGGVLKAQRMPALV